MQFAKKAVGFIVLAASFSFAFYVYFAGKTDLIPGVEMHSTQKETPAAVLTEKATRTPEGTQAENLPALQTGESAPSGDSGAVTGNLTESFMRFLSKSIVDRNPGGPQVFDGQNAVAIPSELDAQGFITKAGNELKNAGLDSKDPAIYVRPLPKDQKLQPKPVTLAKKAELEKYLLSVREILWTISKNISPTMSVSGGKDEAIKTASEIVSFYNNAIKNLEAITPPVELADFHSQELLLVKAQQDVFEKITGIESDPLATLLAYKKLSAINEQFKTLTVNTTVFVVEHGLFGASFN